MDEELRSYLQAMEARLTAGVDAWGNRLESEQIKLRSELNAIDARLMARLNNSEERILNKLASMEADASNTKGFLLNDAAIATRRWFDLEIRVTKLEDDKKS